jgi:hypothetical protein
MLGLREHTLLSNFLLLDTIYKAVDFNASRWISLITTQNPNNQAIWPEKGYRFLPICQ